MYEADRPDRGYRTRELKTGTRRQQARYHEQFLERQVRRPKKASKKPASVKK